MNTDRPQDEQRPSTPATPKARADDRDDSSKTTPASDMQVEDATAAGSEGGPPTGASEPRAAKAMKQQSRTDAQR